MPFKKAMTVSNHFLPCSQLKSWAASRRPLRSAESSNSPFCGIRTWAWWEFPFSLFKYHSPGLDNLTVTSPLYTCTNYWELENWAKTSTDCQASDERKLVNSKHQTLIFEKMKLSTWALAWRRGLKSRHKHPELSNNNKACKLKFLQKVPTLHPRPPLRISQTTSLMQKPPLPHVNNQTQVALISNQAVRDQMSSVPRKSGMILPSQKRPVATPLK